MCVTRRFSATIRQSSSYLSILLYIALPFFGGCTNASKGVIRVGLLPNLAHAHALVAANMSREGEKGWFEKRLGPGIDVQWFVFHAGPSVMEAIFAGSIDLAYIGPCPALNGHVRSNGKEIRVLSGGATAGGGEALVVRSPEWTYASDLRGKTICTPQLGNTQDVACRTWFIHNGMQVNLTSGGDVHIVPLASPDIFTQFSKGAIDGAWTVEPWVSRLLTEAGGHVLYRPRASITTVLITSASFLRRHPTIVQKFLSAHQALTTWIIENPEKAQERVHKALLGFVKQDVVSLNLIRKVWKRLNFKKTVQLLDFEQFMADAHLSKLLSREDFDLSNLMVSTSRLHHIP